MVRQLGTGSLRQRAIKIILILLLNSMIVFISITVLPRTLFPRYTSDNVPLAFRGVDSFQILKISFKVQNRVSELSTMLVKWLLVDYFIC